MKEVASQEGGSRMDDSEGGKQEETRNGIGTNHKQCSQVREREGALTLNNLGVGQTRIYHSEEERRDNSHTIQELMCMEKKKRDLGIKGYRM